MVDNLIPLRERHSTGLTVEERTMCDLLAHLCISRATDHVIDIAAGTCSILKSAYHRLYWLKRNGRMPHDHRSILKQIHMIEPNNFIAKLGVLRFALINPIDETEIGLDQCDAFSISPRADMDVILCNPPYLRQADIPKIYKRKMRSAIEENYRAQGFDGYSAYSLGQSDKYFYFVEWGMLFLKPGGTAGYILSDKFLDSKNGRYLKSFLKEHTKIIAVIKYSGKYFEGFDVTTCFVILERKRPGQDCSNNIVRFIRLYKDDLPKERIKNFLNCDTNINTSEARIVVVRQGDLSPEEKWGKKLLNLPPLYDYCLNRDFMKPLGELFGPMKKRGRDNGCNSFFFPKSKRFNKGRGEHDEDFRRRKRKYENTIHRLVDSIEGRFLKYALNSADLPKHYVLRRSDISKEPLFVIPPDTDIRRYRGLNSFIQFASEVYTDRDGNVRSLLDGELGRIPERPTVGNRDPWYCLYKNPHQEDQYALIIPRMHRATFKILIPTSRVYFSTNFVGFGRMGEVDINYIKFLAGFLMSSFGQLQFEKESAWREGLLKIEAGVLYKIKVPDPSRIKETVKNKVVQAFENLDFGINGLEAPGRENPRFDLDMAVMELFYPPRECKNRTLEVEQALFQTVIERDPENRTR